MTEISGAAEAGRLEAFLSGLTGIEDSPLTAITGSGGKTALLLAMARLLREKGRVAVTTTTKIALAEGNACGGLFIGSSREAIEKIAAMPPRGSLAVARAIRGGKLYGFTPPEADAICQSGAADWLLVEADGSRSLPLKAYEEWEPPVPGLTSLQIVVVGADAFIRPFGAETAFRPELLEKRFGLRRGEIPDPRTAARILSSRGEYLKNSPPRTRRALILNKAEILAERELADIMQGLSGVTGYSLLAAVSLKNGVVYDIVKFDGGKSEQ